MLFLKRFLGWSKAQTVDPEALLYAVINYNTPTIPLSRKTRSFISTTLAYASTVHVVNPNYNHDNDTVLKADMLQSAKKCSTKELKLGLDFLFDCFTNDRTFGYARSFCLEALLPVIIKNDPYYAWYACDQIYTAPGIHNDVKNRIALKTWSIYPDIVKRDENNEFKKGFKVLLQCAKRVPASTNEYNQVSSELVKAINLCRTDTRWGYAGFLIEAAKSRFSTDSDEWREINESAKIIELRKTGKNISNEGGVALPPP